MKKKNNVGGSEAMVGAPNKFLDMIYYGKVTAVIHHRSLMLCLAREVPFID